MPDLRASLRLAYGAHARQHYDLFVPEKPASGVLVVVVHGGWWTHGRHEDLRPFCLALAEAGYASAALGYRLLGDGARNGQELVDDLKLGASKALEEAAVAGLGGNAIILLGSGAGSLLALTAAAQLAEEKLLHVRVRGVAACGVSPTLEHWEGITAPVARALDQFAGPHRHELSPLHLKADGFPPLLLLHGDDDEEVPARIAQRLHARVVEANESSTFAVLSGLGHQFIEQVNDRGARTALERLVPFLQEHGRDLQREALFAGRREVG